MTRARMIKTTIKREGKPTVVYFFENVKQAKIYNEWLEEFVAAIKEKTRHETI